MTDERNDSDRLIALRRRWEEDPSAQVALQLAEEYRALERQDEGLQILSDSVERFPRHLASRVALGRYQLEVGRHDEAARVLEAVVEQDPTHLIANKLLVRLYLETGRPKQARDRLDLYRLLNEGDPEIEELIIGVKELEGGGISAGDARPEPEPTPEKAEVRARDEGTALLEDTWADAPVLDRASEKRSEVELLSRSPFPGEKIWAGLGDVAYWRSFAAEGIFVVPDAPQALAPSGTWAPAVIAGAAATEPIASQPEPSLATVAARAPTVTLAGLYLRQGHLDEAERTLRQVLEREPENRAALSELQEVERQRRAGDPGADSEDSGDEVAGDLRARKIGALRSYLRRLRGGKGRG